MRRPQLQECGPSPLQVPLRSGVEPQMEVGHQEERRLPEHKVALQPSGEDPVAAVRVLEDLRRSLQGRGLQGNLIEYVFGRAYGHGKRGRK